MTKVVGSVKYSTLYISYLATPYFQNWILTHDRLLLTEKNEIVQYCEPKKFAKTSWK